MRKILTALVAAASISGAAIGTQSRPGRIITRMATTADTTDTDQVPITDPSRAAVCGTVMLGYPLASFELGGGG
jgi:hypothetical protein